MFKAVRNLLIVLAMLAAGVAIYYSVAPNEPNTILIRNMSGTPAESLEVAILSQSGQTLKTAQSTSLGDGGSFPVRHGNNEPSVAVSFSLAGTHHDHTEPYVDFWRGETWAMDIQPDGTIKLTVMGP